MTEAIHHTPIGSHRVSIAEKGEGCYSLTVDGKDLSHITSAVSLKIEAGKFPAVGVTLGAMGAAFEGQAAVALDGVTLPPGVEVAVFRALAQKYLVGADRLIERERVADGAHRFVMT